jgi:hypothetical protein
MGATLIAGTGVFIFILAFILFLSGSSLINFYHQAGVDLRNNTGFHYGIGITSLLVGLVATGFAIVLVCWPDLIKATTDRFKKRAADAIPGKKQ